MEWYEWFLFGMPFEAFLVVCAIGLGLGIVGAIYGYLFLDDN